VNVCIYYFDDAKEESNEADSKDKHCFKINTRLFQQTKSCFKWKYNCVINYQKPVIDYQWKKFRKDFLKIRISSNHFEKARRAYMCVCLISKSKREIFQENFIVKWSLNNSWANTCKSIKSSWNFNCNILLLKREFFFFFFLFKEIDWGTEGLLSCKDSWTQGMGCPCMVQTL